MPKPGDLLQYTNIDGDVDFDTIVGLWTQHAPGSYPKEKLFPRSQVEGLILEFIESDGSDNNPYSIYVCYSPTIGETFRFHKHALTPISSSKC